MKKLLTVLLILAMLLSLPVMGVAAEDAGAAGNTAGETTDTGAAGTSLGLYGYQNAIVAAGAETVSVRVIAEVADVDAYASLCFRVKTAKAEKDYPVTSVYGKLTASVTDGDGTAFETELLPGTEGNYLAAVILTDIPVSADAEMTITPCGTLKDGTAVTGNAGTLRKPADKTNFTAAYQVTFKTKDGEEFSTVSVNRGENAPLPAAKDGYYWTVDLAELVNITENKTITLGQVATSAYANDKTVTKISTTSANEAVNSEKYALTLGTINESGTQPNQNASWTFLYQLGQTLQFTADFADTLLLKMRCQDATSMTVAVYVDGYLVKNVTVNSVDQQSTTNLTVGELIPAGEHTVRLVVTDLVGTPSKLRGFSISEI